MTKPERQKQIRGCQGLGRGEVRCDFGGSPGEKLGGQLCVLVEVAVMQIYPVVP